MTIQKDLNGLIKAKRPNDIIKVKLNELLETLRQFFGFAIERTSYEEALKKFIRYGLALMVSILNDIPTLNPKL